MTLMKRSRGTAMGDWLRVSARNPCPICEHPDWCGYTDDGAVRCMRVTDEPGWRRISSHSDGGTTFRPDDEVEGHHQVRRVSVAPPASKLSNWKNVQAELLTDGMERSGLRNALAVYLGVMSSHLFMLGIGWHKGHKAWSFPMYDHNLKVVGIRLRHPNGDKRAIKGSSDGVFATLNRVADLDGSLFICEGPTDTAAVMKLGIYKVIGRANCRANTGTIKHLAVDQDVVIVADQDEPGQQGATLLGNALQGIAKSATIVTPPSKDIRTWVKAGATTTQFMELVCETQQVQRGPC